MRHGQTSRPLLPEKVGFMFLPLVHPQPMLYLHSKRDADRSGNCPAGFLVFDQITSPKYQAFYLQSHAGLLGSMSSSML